MVTLRGVVQGYTAGAAVDAKRQIILDAQSPGTGLETELRLPVLEAVERFGYGRLRSCQRTPAPSVRSISGRWSRAASPRTSRRLLVSFSVRHSPGGTSSGVVDEPRSRSGVAKS